MGEGWQGIRGGWGEEGWGVKGGWGGERDEERWGEVGKHTEIQQIFRDKRNGGGGATARSSILYTDCSYLLYILLLFFITNNLLKDHKTICTKRAVKEIYSFIYKWLIISIEGNYEVSRSCPA